MTDTVGKVAIVTGASRGIGAAIARRLGADGFAVVVNYAGSADAAAEVVGAIEAAGGRAVSAQADVADPGAVARMFDSAQDAFGGVDVLVNNAGVMQLKPLAESDDDLFDRTLAVNLKGTFNSMREAARRMRDGGRVINFSSSVVGVYGPTYGVYAATKAAVEAMTHVLSKELGARQINVNAVAPGPVGTELFLHGKSDEMLNRIKGMIPFGRLGEPDDIASVVSFLAGPDGAWVNGQVLRTNGGMI